MNFQVNCLLSLAALGLLLPLQLQAEDAPRTPLTVPASDLPATPNQADAPLVNLASCEPAPKWDVRLGAVFLKREVNQGPALVVNADTGAALFNTGDFHFNYEVGPDIQISRRLGKRWALEARYFSVDSWLSHVDRAFAEPASLNVNPPVLFSRRPSIMAWDYGSDLFSTELNVRRDLGRNFSVSTGFRWVEFNETLNLAGGVQIPGVPFPTARVTATTDNRLYGWQVGGQARFRQDRALQFEAVGKAGVYGNAAQHHFSASNIFGFAFATSADDDRPAFLGELGLRAVWKPTANISLGVGYEVLFLDGVSLAPDQFATQPKFFPAAPTTRPTIDQSDALFHGATVWLGISW